MDLNTCNLYADYYIQERRIVSTETRVYVYCRGVGEANMHTQRHEEKSSQVFGETDVLVV